MPTNSSKFWRRVQVLVIVAASLPGCDAMQSSAPSSTSGTNSAGQPDDPMTAYRKTLPPVPDALQPLARELDQLLKQQKRVPIDATTGPLPKVVLPGALPYRIAEGGKMVEIDLTYTPVTDDFLKKLQSLPDLEVLDLNGTMITDEGLENLGAAPALKKLFLLLTKVTKAGVDKFRESHPACEVSGPDLR